MHIRVRSALAVLLFFVVPAQCLAQTPAAGLTPLSVDVTPYLNKPIAVICNNPMRTLQDSLAVHQITGKSCEDLNIPRPTVDELKTYGQDAIVDVCNSPLRTIQQVHEVATFGIDCDAMHNSGGWIKYGIYGYNHPTPAVCNSGNGLKAGLLSFVTGNSIGNKNLISGIGLLLSTLFAGCNNAPVQQGANRDQSVASTPAATVIAAPPSATLAKNATSTVRIYEPGYAGNFFATSLDSNIVKVDPGPKPPKSNGGDVEFQLTAVKPGTTTVVFMDDGGQHSTPVSVNVTP